MVLLTVQVILSSLSFLTESPTILPKIENLPTFETSWNANMDLAVAMSKDTRVAEIVDPTNWKRLADVSSYLDVCAYLHKSNATKWKMLKEVSIFLNRKDSPLTLFVVLNELLIITSVETIVKSYPEYQKVLVATRSLVISITENIGPQDVTPDNWRRLLEITRMEITGIEKPDCENVTVTENCTELCEQQWRKKTKYLEKLNPDLTHLFRDFVPSTSDAALGVIQLGHLLKLPSLVKSSSKVIEEGLSTNNVVQIFQETISVTELKDLNNKAEEYILLEFEKIFKEDKNFTSLKFDELYSLLMSDKLTVPNEYLVFEAIAHWVQSDVTSREEHVTILMKAVRLHLCSLSQLKTMANHSLLAGSESIIKSIQSVIHLMESNSPELTDLVKKTQRHLQETLFVIGASSTGSIETFSPSKQKWIYDVRLNNGPLGPVSTVVLGRTIIVFDYVSYSVTAFDPVKKDWKRISTLPINRQYFAVAELNGLIYVLGGRTGGGGHTATDLCQTLNPKTGEWNTLPNLNETKYMVGATTLQGKIYIAGGYRYGHQPLSTVEIFDPKNSRWIIAKPLNYPRWEAALVTEGYNVWAFGGYNAQNLNVVEKYDTVIGTWSNMPEMPTPRRAHSAVYFNGNFFVISGESKNTVEVYNPRLKTWKQSADLINGRAYFGASVVKDLPNAYEYI